MLVHEFASYIVILALKRSVAKSLGFLEVDVANFWQGHLGAIWTKYERPMNTTGGKWRVIPLWWETFCNTDVNSLPEKGKHRICKVYDTRKITGYAKCLWVVWKCLWTITLYLLGFHHVLLSRYSRVFTHMFSCLISPIYFYSMINSKIHISTLLIYFRNHRCNHLLSSFLNMW